MHSDGALVAASCFIKPFTKQNTGRCGYCALYMITSRLSIAERQPLFVSVMRLSSLLLHTLAVCLPLPETPVVGKAISSSLIT